jgi:hypothetical protein
MAPDDNPQYERLMANDPAFAKAHTNDFKGGRPASADSAALVGAVQWLKSGTEGQRKLAHERRLIFLAFARGHRTLTPST